MALWNDMSETVPWESWAGMGRNPGVIEGVCREGAKWDLLAPGGGKGLQPQQGQSGVGLPESLLHGWAGEFPELVCLHFQTMPSFCPGLFPALLGGTAGFALCWGQLS